MIALLLLALEGLVVLLLVVLCYKVYVGRRRRGAAHAVLLAVAQFSPGGATARQVEVEAERTLGCRLGSGQIWSILAGLEHDRRVASRWCEGPRPDGPRRLLYHTVVPLDGSVVGTDPTLRRRV